MERLADRLFPVACRFDFIGMGIGEQVATGSVFESDFQLPANFGMSLASEPLLGLSESRGW